MLSQATHSCCTPDIAGVVGDLFCSGGEDADPCGDDVQDVLFQVVKTLILVVTMFGVFCILRW